VCATTILKENRIPVKLIVIYPHPTDIQAFETIYNRDHVPMAVEKLTGKTKITATRVLDSPKREASLLPHRRDSFSFHGGPGSVRSFRRRQTDPCERGFDFVRRCADLSDSGGGGFCILNGQAGTNPGDGGCADTGRLAMRSCRHLTISRTRIRDT
jgi:hypothetical protein